jgi:UDP-3-O-[3-hydroxymyristoyl] N-acetylglucosamine deacetylase / 3-hydroxyacyl-[acyl-carrier-protein] dehydratase
VIIKQRCLEKPVSIKGTGLHTGQACKVTFYPAPVNHGLIFEREVDGEKVRIPADINNVVSVDRGTVLEVKKVKVHTVEHLLAGLAGLGIDNCLIEMTGPEPPILDGSAKQYMDAIKEAGIEELDEDRNFLELDSTIVYHDEGGVDIVVVPSEEFRVTYMVDYSHASLGTQYTSMYGWDEFEDEFGAARTFCLASELVAMKERNLIQGGDLDSALVFVDVDEEKVNSLKEIFHVNPVAENLEENRILGGQKLHWPNEPVRHKVLDLAGDLCLLGQPLKGHVLVARGGHPSHVELVRLLKKEAIKKSLQKEYQRNITADIVFDTAAIERILPHRYPMLLVDRITELRPGEFVRGIKCVTMNEPFFQGHFPGHPIMPGVLIVEAMGQTGGILLLNSFDRPEEKVVYFMGFDKVKFRKPVKPGDQLVMEAKMLKMRRGMCSIEAKAYVDGVVVTSAEMSAMVVDK